LLSDWGTKCCCFCKITLNLNSIHTKQKRFVQKYASQSSKRMCNLPSLWTFWAFKKILNYLFISSPSGREGQTAQSFWFESFKSQVQITSAVTFHPNCPNCPINVIQILDLCSLPRNLRDKLPTLSLITFGSLSQLLLYPTIPIKSVSVSSQNREWSERIVFISSEGSNFRSCWVSHIFKKYQTKMELELEKWPEQSHFARQISIFSGDLAVTQFSPPFRFYQNKTQDSHYKQLNRGFDSFRLPSD
jgi:hypothetical protein